MTDTATTPRNVWRTRAVAAAQALCARGIAVTLARHDVPTPCIVVRLGDKTPHVFASYRDAALRLEAWGEVL